MSWAAAHQSKSVRKICRRCRARKARFRYRGIVKSDREHVLCFECYRSEVNRLRARRLTSGARRISFSLPVVEPALNGRRFEKLRLCHSTTGPATKYRRQLPALVSTFPFNVTVNEVRCSEALRNEFQLHRVFNFGRAARLYPLKEPLSQTCHLDAAHYRAFVHKTTA